MAATFEDIAETDQVGIDVGVRIFDGITDTGLGGQMHDGIETMFAEQLCHPVTINDIQLLELKCFVLLATFEARLFQGYIVVIVQIVDAINVVATTEQP